MPSPTLAVRAPLLWLLLPLMAGLTAARLWPPPSIGLWPVLLAASLTATAAVVAAVRDRPWTAMPALVLAGLLAGFALLPLRHPGLHDRSGRPPREISVELQVSDLFASPPDGRSLSGLGVVVSTGGHDADLIGQLIAFSAHRRISVTPRLAARYQIRGVLEPLPTGVPGDGFTDYLHNRGVRHRLGRAQLERESAPPDALARGTGHVRSVLVGLLGHGLDRHPGIAALYRAMLLGERAALSPAQENAFLRSGTLHVFCVSGLHVGMIATALTQLGRILRLPRRAGAAVTLLVLALYVQVTGTGTPAVRAYVMVAFLLASRVWQLPGNPLAALTASALVTLLLEPLQLFSTGFQMSYAVVAALILYGGPLGDCWLAHWHPFALRPRPEWRWWHERIDWFGRKAIAGAAGGTAAFLGSAAAGIGFFGVFAPGSLLANLVIIPLAGLVIVAGFLSLLTGLSGLLPLSALFNAAAALLIMGADALLQHGTQLPGVFFPATFRADWLAPASMTLLTGVLLAGASVGWTRRRGGFWPPVIVLGLLLSLGVKFG